MSLIFTKSDLGSNGRKALHEEVASQPLTAAGAPIILLVEDDKEALAYLNKELKTCYTILRASSDAEARDILVQNEVHLVLTEIQTLLIDGISLCTHIKTTSRYSHIPVVFLAQQQPLEVKIQGLNSGADAYIEKPFTVEFLQAQMQNVLHNRQIVKNYFANARRSDIVSTSGPAIMDGFIDRLYNVIYDHISDMDLTVNELARLMHMSRPTLYRKVKQHTDLTPNEMINLSKLKKAAELLAEKKYTVTQVASMVGYTVQSNFSRDFHKHYGIRPSMYIVGAQKQHDVAS